MAPFAPTAPCPAHDETRGEIRVPMQNKMRFALPRDTIYFMSVRSKHTNSGDPDPGGSEIQFEILPMEVLDSAFIDERFAVIRIHLRIQYRGATYWQRAN
jgi:hypothetical protein